jgi:hypothetical protein
VRLPDLRQLLAHNRGLPLGMVGAGFLHTGAETTLNVWLPKFQIYVFGAGATREERNGTIPVSRPVLLESHS